MDYDKCGCENGKLDKEIEEKLKEDTGCDCGEETKEAPEEDGGCGCGNEGDETQEGGCCGSVDIPDLSLVENPDHPKFMAEADVFKELEDYAYSLGIESIGYTQLTSDLLIKDKFVRYPFTIVLTMEMDKKILETPPGADAKDLNDTAYVRAAILTTKLSDYLRNKGYETEVAHPEGGFVNFSTLAQKAGLGYIGDSGLLITPELGPRLKISAIFVSIANLPVNEDNMHSWIAEYCDKCGKCVKSCPKKALIEKETCCGKEIEIIQKNCIGCSQGCTYCIEACPFEEKGYEHVKNKFDKMRVKLKEKQAKKFKVDLWDSWVKQNSDIFTDLVNGTSIAIAIFENNERGIFLEKENNDLNVNIKHLNELESSNADLLLVMDEKCLGELLNDPSTVKFTDLLSSGKIEIYGLNDDSHLRDKGYIAFLNNLGISIDRETCCC